MNSEKLSDQRLADLMKHAFSERLRASTHTQITFEELWLRARNDQIAASQTAGISIWIRRGLVPACAIAVAFFLAQFGRQSVNNTPLEIAPYAQEVNLRLPSDSLLDAAQKSFVTAKIDFKVPEVNLNKFSYPTDSLKWRAQ